MERGIFVPMMIPAFPDNPCGGGGAGTVTSVGITAPAIFAVTNSPVTTTGVIDLALVAQSPNLVFASPTTGAPAAPTFRTLVAADLGTGTPTVNTVLRGDMTWGAPLEGWLGTLHTTAPNNVVNVSRLLVNTPSSDGDAVIEPKGAGALLAQLPDGNSSGGVKRGQYVVDLQRLRNNPGFVAQGNYSVIVGGGNNAVYGSFSSVLGGFENWNNGSWSSIVGGGINLSYATYTFVGGGYANQAGGDYAFIAGGRNAVTTRYAQSAHSAGTFVAGVGGLCQKETMILRTITTTATPTNLTLDGSATLSNSTQISLLDNTAYSFRGLVTATRQDAAGESAMWEISGGIDRHGGTTALVGCPQVRTLGDDSSGAWVVTVDADNTNDVLTITVTGQNAKTIYWGCFVDLMTVQRT